eukprot:4120810-Amphidinium_carterae.1
MERSHKAVFSNTEDLDSAHRSDAALWNRAFEGVPRYIEFAHDPHHWEAVWERPLKAVSIYTELRDSAHRSDDTLWNRSFETIPLRDCAHHSDAALGKRAFEGIKGDIEDAHRPQHLEPTPRERSLEAIGFDDEVRDCVHLSDAAPWQRSLEAVSRVMDALAKQLPL